MIDLETIGKAGLIIQYEDVISLMGYNIAEYFKQNKLNEKFERMSYGDILLSYINREHYDIDEWFKTVFDYQINISKLLSSKIMMKPNLVYAYKVFHEAAKQGNSNLMIYSNHYSDAIESLLPSFEVPALTYQHDNLVELLNNHRNCTFITNNPDSIELCKSVKAPFVLTIPDDFQYITDISLAGIDELRKQYKLVFFTSVISGGISNVIHD